MSDNGKLEIAIERRDHGSVSLSFVRVSGEVDLGNADDFAAALESQSAEDGLVLDLTEVPFMDSSGLRVLLLAAQREHPVALVLGEDSAVAHLLEVAEVADRVRSFATEGEALDSFGS